MREIVLPYVNITYIEPIIYCKYNKGVELGFPEIGELVSSIETLCRKKPTFIFSDVRLVKNITKEGRRMLEKYSSIPYCMGTAICIREIMDECTQDFVTSYTPNFPFRAFNSEQEATDWLLTLPLDC